MIHDLVNGEVEEGEIVDSEDEDEEDQSGNSVSFTYFNPASTPSGASTSTTT